MAVLVTGGLGAIGSMVVRHLVEKGMQPVVYDSRGDTTLVKDLVDEIKVVAEDVVDLGRLIQVIRDYEIDRIIHLAAVLLQAEGNPTLGARVNIGGTLNILEAARLAGVTRVVYASAKAAYGDFPGEYGYPTYKPVTEDYPRNPNSVYGATKVFCENMGQHYHQKWGLDWIGLRFASTFGPGKASTPGSRHEGTGPHIAIIQNAIFGLPTRVAHGGDERDDTIYNKDVARGIVLACFVDKVKHRIFNIGTGVGVTLKDLAEAVREVFPGADIEVGPGLDYLRRGWQWYAVFDISRAREELGYVPQYGLVAGVRDYVETLRKLGLAPAS